MRTINRNGYSRHSFPDYELRLIIELATEEGEHRVDIYTTETNTDAVYEDLIDIISEKVMSFTIIHSATKEQDDLASDLIEEFLNEY